MFYAHVKISEDVIIKADLTNLEITGVCPICGAEYQTELEDIMDLPEGMFNDAPFCDTCSEELLKLSPIPEGQTSREFAWLDLLTKSEYPSPMFTWALHNAPKEAINAAADRFVSMVPGYHNDLPLGDINNEIARRGQEAKKHDAGRK